MLDVGLWVCSDWPLPPKVVARWTLFAANRPVINTQQRLSSAEGLVRSTASRQSGRTPCDPPSPPAAVAQLGFAGRDFGSLATTDALR